MALRLLPVSGHRRMPWKNGGGITTEIAISPEGASLDSFDWRISLADVESDGAFSLFADCERTLGVLQGEGLDLDFGKGRVERLDQHSPPFRFAADVPVTGRLHMGPIRDLNVMTRRGKAQHTVKRLVLQGWQKLSTNSDILLLIAITTPVHLRHDSKRYRLDAGDGVIVQQATDQLISIEGQDALAYVIEIDASGC